MHEDHSCRIVDALLENDVEAERRQSKRRKLTLLLESAENRGSLSASTSSRSAKQKIALKVLDPLTRLVDDSLQKVHMGNRPIAEHFRMVTTDSRFMSSQNPRRWLQWCHSSGGNLLHACALWNDVEMAGDLLQIPNLATLICEALDGDGRTPYEVAQLSGHDSVCEVLEAFGGDATNFVYDIFCLDGDGEDTPDNDEDHQMTVELTDGVAYWTPTGELMLETNDKISAFLDDDDGDVDSNCEDYGANDYPDDEEEEEVNVWDEDDRAYSSMYAVDHEDWEEYAPDPSYLRREARHGMYAEQDDFNDCEHPYLDG